MSRVPSHRPKAPTPSAATPQEAATSVAAPGTKEPPAQAAAGFEGSAAQSSWVKRSPPMVRLKNHTIDVTRPPPLDVSTSLVPPEVPKGEQLFIVQFETQMLPGHREAIADVGGRIESSLGDNAFAVRLSVENLVDLQALNFVRGVVPFAPGYKLSTLLVDRLANGRGNALIGATVATDLVAASLASKGELLAEVERIIARDGVGRVLNREEGTTLLRVSLSGEQLQELSRHPAVMWAEEASSPEVDVDNAREQGGVNAVQRSDLADPRFTGRGLKVHIFEGIEASHVEFTGPHRTSPIAVWEAGSTSHGTATAGVIAAQGVRPDAKGIVPDAQLLYTPFTAIEGRGGSRSRMELTDELVERQGIDSQTASWGFARTTSYTARSRELDEIIFKHDLPVTQSQSNSGSGLSRPQAWAKNVIAVLAARHFDNTDISDDQWDGGGSTREGDEVRIGRSLSGYFDNIRTTALVNSYTEEFGGTSGATPMVNGFLNVVIQMWKEGEFRESLARPDLYDPTRRPHAATMAALLMASAQQYPFEGDNHDLARTHVGWGFPDVARLYEQRDKLFVVDEEDVLQVLQSRTYELEVAPGEPELKASMVYMDPPAAVNALKTQVNDLHLKVTAPDGTVYWGNEGLLAGNYSRPGGAPDELDTVENVFVKDPQPGKWTFEVIAAVVNEDAHLETPEVDVDFALVVLGAKRPPAQAA